ncbi:DUF5984 family protein [Micromonospora sp. NPDC005237]|uniref:DUF5984 family protein n=1 Tax=Micromonospora sp. NPDC005237 TaxID=3155113 RepID=UPI0033BD3522
MPVSASSKAWLPPSRHRLLRYTPAACGRGSSSTGSAGSSTRNRRRSDRQPETNVHRPQEKGGHGRVMALGRITWTSATLRNAPHPRFWRTLHGDRDEVKVDWYHVDDGEIGFTAGTPVRFTITTFEYPEAVHTLGRERPDDRVGYALLPEQTSSPVVAADRSRSSSVGLVAAWTWSSSTCPEPTPLPALTPRL